MSSKYPPGWHLFLDLCRNAKTDQRLTELFDLLFTPEEAASIETRCLIIQSLLEGQTSQRQLSEKLQVSIAKITRGSNSLKRIAPELKQYLQEILLGT